MTERLAPVDEITGVPLPILPVEAPWHIQQNHFLWREYGREDHHHAFFPNEALPGQGEAPDRVLRHSRLQYGARWQHSRYHALFDALESYPQSEEEYFRTAILASAGYIPDYAVDIRTDTPTLAVLTEAERRRMQEETIFPERRISDLTGKDLHRMNRGMFFMKHALDQNFDHVKETLLEEFIETKNMRRRLKLGFFIVDMAFMRATEDIDFSYRVAHYHGRIHPSLPKHTVGFLRKVVDGHQPDYFNTLGNRILAHAS